MKTAEEILKKFIPNGTINIRLIGGGNGKPQSDYEKKVLIEMMEAYHSSQMEGAIHCKALRKKGTDNIYFWPVNQYEWIEGKYPYTLPFGKEENNIYKIPADAELVDLIIIEKPKP